MRACTLRWTAALTLTCWIGGPVFALAQNVNTPLWRVPLESLSDTRDRPLFSPARRPAVTAAPAAGDAAPGLDRLRVTLLGVLLGPENSGVAVMRDEETQALKEVQVGDTLNHWTLVELRRRAAVFQRDADIMVLEMPKAPAQPAKSGGVTAAADAPPDGIPPDAEPPPVASAPQP